MYRPLIVLDRGKLIAYDIRDGKKVVPVPEQMQWMKLLCFPKAFCPAHLDWDGDLPRAVWVISELHGLGRRLCR